MVEHAFNLILVSQYMEGRGRGSEFEASLAYRVKPCLNHTLFLKEECEMVLEESMESAEPIA